MKATFTIDRRSAYRDTVLFTIDGIQYKIGLLDERPDVELDPTLLVFRGDEEVAILTLHLDPSADCLDRAIDHVVARPGLPDAGPLLDGIESV